MSNNEIVSSKKLYALYKDPQIVVSPDMGCNLKFWCWGNYPA